MIKKIYLLLLLMGLFTITHESVASTAANYPAVVKEMEQLGDDLMAHYQPANNLATMDGLSNLYFNQYEGSGMELQVASISPGMNKKTEALFTQIIGSAAEGVAVQELTDIWSHLKIQLNADLEVLQKLIANNFIESFIQSFTILLREGFEALLVVTALLAYLRRFEHNDKCRVIYYGVGLALVASVVTAFLFRTIFKSAGSQREALEGIVMLIAAFVLFYVSYWLFAKREAEKWQQFIRQKMNKALSTGNMFALGTAAFLAVYREGAETILFYQALLIGNKGQTTAIVTGFGAACFTLILLYRVMQTASHKIPFKLFFTMTAIFLYYMAFYFIGGGILELQTAGIINASVIQGFPQITWLGIFPTWQNVSAQLAFLLPTLGALIWWYVRQRDSLTRK